MKSDLRVALIQEKGTDTPDECLRTLAQKISEAAKGGAKLILLQELHNHRYFPQIEDPHYFDLAETIPGPSTQFFSNLAKQHQVVIVASLFEKRAPGLYHNTAVVIEKNGEIAGIYRKMHIPDDPGFYEKFYFTPGDLGFEPIQTSVGSLGVLVCWDQWFPEAARLMALGGADLLLYPTAIGWNHNEDSHEHALQLDAWITVQRAHAIANNTPVLVCNRVGEQKPPKGHENSPTINFWGNSFVAGPQGEILSQANAQSCTVLICDIPLKRTEQVRRLWPFLRDRRIDAYKNINKRFLKGFVKADDSSSK